MVNRRRYTRVAFFVPATVNVLPERAQLTANTTDLSLGGVGLVAPRLLPVGQVVAIRFVLGASTTTEVMGRVVHGRADEAGCVMGIEFLRLLDGESQPELMGLLLKRCAAETRT